MHISFKPDPTLYPFESHWFETAIGKMHYIDEGQGQPILFCHGNPTWSFLYRNIILKLRGNFRCIAVDYLGFGLSDRPTAFGYTPAEHAIVVASLVKHLGLKNYLIMGQDWGGPIGMATALADPENVQGLIFGNTWFWRGEIFTNIVFSLVMSTPIMQWLIIKRNFFVEKIIPLGTARKYSELELDQYRKAQPGPELRRGPAEFPIQIRKAQRWLAIVDAGVQKHLAHKPLLLVWGMQDIIAKNLLGRWLKIFPDHVLIKLPKAKHYIQEDAPNEIAEAIIKRFGKPS